MSLSDQEILELHELLDALVENNLAGERRKRLEAIGIVWNARLPSTPGD